MTFLSVWRVRVIAVARDGDELGQIRDHRAVLCEAASEGERFRGEHGPTCLDEVIHLGLEFASPVLADHGVPHWGVVAVQVDVRTLAPCQRHASSLLDMATFWDMARSSRDESWRRIRSLRANPPSPVTRYRREIFTAALEQAEQQFLAASAVGVQSRPLNLFYGLSQAGRAASAALTPPDGPYLLQGHGISCPGIDGGILSKPVESFSSLLVSGDMQGKGSFTHLSNILHSAQLIPAVPIGRLLRMLVEAELHEPFEAEGRPVMHVDGMPHNENMLRINMYPVDPEFTNDSYHQMAHDYPSLAGFEVSRIEGARTDTRGRPYALVELLHRTSNDPTSVGVNYRGARVAMPSVDEAGHALHPLMVWWAVLFALSMLARYHPAAWTAITNVDKSPHAVPLEHLLQVAQDAVPDILWRTISGEP